MEPAVHTEHIFAFDVGYCIAFMHSVCIQF